jgi:hypothetical protein
MHKLVMSFIAAIWGFVRCVERGSIGPCSTAQAEGFNILAELSKEKIPFSLPGLVARGSNLLSADKASTVER